MQEEFGRDRQRVDPGDRLAERRRHVLVGRLAEADVAVADLHEIERARRRRRQARRAAVWPSAREVRTPPFRVQSTPVPAQAMHLRKPRRSMPSCAVVVEDVVIHGRVGLQSVRANGRTAPLPLYTPCRPGLFRGPGKKIHLSGIGNKPTPRGVIIPMEASVPTETSTFEQLMLPHLDSAYNLARWLLRDPHDAEDAVQDACLRAFRAFGGFRGATAAPGSSRSCATCAIRACARESASPGRWPSRRTFTAWPRTRARRTPRPGSRRRATSWAPPWSAFPPNSGR